MTEAGVTGDDIGAMLPELAARRGKEVGVSDWKLIGQSEIDQFSALTGDGGPHSQRPGGG